MDQFTEIVYVAFAIAISGLAGNQIADTWTVGKIFERPQTWLRARRKASKVAELLTCPFCLSHWTTLACLPVLLLTDWDSLARIPVYWLAAVKVAALVQRDEEISVDQTDAVDGFEVIDDESPD